MEMIGSSTPYYCRRAPLFISIIVLLVCQGCSGPKVSTKTSVELNRYAITSLVVLPFTAIESPQLIESTDPYMGVPEGAKRSDISPEGIPPPRGRLTQTTSSISPHVPERITELVWNRLRDKQGIRVVAPREAMKTAEASSGEREPMMEETVASRTAKRLAVDAALIGKVLVYQERVGGPFGASPPAAVGFEVKVIASDGSLLWEGNYYERQRPMNEDFIDAVRRHGLYVTADELAQFGTEALVKAMPFGTSR